MDKNNVFWLVIWMLAAIVLICGFHGCRKAMELDYQHGEKMAERGYVLVKYGWIKQ